MSSGKWTGCRVALYMNLSALLYWALMAPIALADDNMSTLALLRQPGHVGLIRHAIAPGTGDPDNFSVEDCSTQRNLSKGGRLQARKLGEALRAAGIEEAQVFSSQWCRCLYTAELLAIGEVRALPTLNSFFGQRSRGPKQIQALQHWLQQQPLDKPTLLITHQVNITGLTGAFPASGEVLILHQSSLEKPVVVERVLIPH